MAEKSGVLGWCVATHQQQCSFMLSPTNFTGEAIKCKIEL